MKKVVLLAFVLVFLSTAVVVRFIRPVKSDWTWTETIYIRADGSVDPDTAPIWSADSITYTLTDNIVGYVPTYASAIIVERDNIVVDGAGYTLQGTGTDYSKGIYLSYRSNVAIKNMEIKSFGYGIQLVNSSSNIIYDNHIKNNGAYGIYLYDSSNNNSISGNTLTENNNCGIYLDGNKGKGPCDNNIISSNNIINNPNYGIGLDDSSNNSIVGNNVTSNNGGIGLDWSSNNTVSANHITDNSGGIVIVSYSRYNIVSGNIMTNNNYGFVLSQSYFNSIYQNDIKNSKKDGIGLCECFNNTIHHNNFVNNTRHVYDEAWDNPALSSSNNTWDDGYPSGGNYWSDYTDVDQYSGPNQDQLGSDGIWDHPYVIDENDQDNYPLVPEFPTWTPMLVTLIMLTVVIAICKRRLFKNSTLTKVF